MARDSKSHRCPSVKNANFIEKGKTPKCALHETTRSRGGIRRTRLSSDVVITSHTYKVSKKISKSCKSLNTYPYDVILFSKQIIKKLQSFFAMTKPISNLCYALVFHLILVNDHRITFCCNI